MAGAGRAMANASAKGFIFMINLLIAIRFEFNRLNRWIGLFSSKHQSHS